jgi:hypothetical protein
MSASAPAIPGNKTTNEPFTLKQRIALWFITLAGYLAIRLIGPTLKFECSIEEGGPATPKPHPAVYVFWHRAVIASCWYYRNRQIAVMTSSSFDGEYIARIIEKFGYKAVRGSTSRGAVRALLGMHTELEQDRSVAFTIDGPRGPLYEAKPGPVLLARNTRVPIVPFFIAAEDGWVLKSWDRFVIPKPYTHVHLRLGRFIPVPPEADAPQIQQLHAEMQAELDRVREYAEAQFPAIKTRA